MFGSRYRGVLTFEEAARMTPAEIAERRAQGWLAPVGGGENDPPADPPADPPKEEEPRATTVPLSELQKERKAKSDLQKRLDAIEAAEAERKKQELSEVDRAKAEKAELEQRVAELSSKAERSEKRGWIRDAASKAGFKDPADAVARIADEIGYDALADEKAVRDAVKDLKNAAPHLVGQEAPNPALKEVLRDGKHSDGKQDSEPLTMADLKGKSTEEIQALLPRLKEQGLIPSQ